MTDADRAVLDLERRFANTPPDGRKEAAALAELGMGRTRYYQVLARLIETRDALAHDPLTVSRLRRLQASRMRTTGRPPSTTKVAAAHSLLLVLLLVAGCTSSPEAKTTANPCVAVTRDVNKLNTELKPMSTKDPSTFDANDEQGQREREMQLRLMARIMTDHPSCYTPKEVAIAQDYLARATP